MDVGIGINGPSEVGTFAHILDVTGKEVDRLNLGYADLCISLLPGTYYIVAESMDYGAGKVVEEGLIYLYIYIDEREIGEDFYYPMDLGTFGSEFTVSHTDNITEYISTVSCSSEAGEQLGVLSYLVETLGGRRGGTDIRCLGKSDVL